MNIRSEIHKSCSESLNLKLITIDNESHLHSSSKASNSHFKLLVVSDDFIDMSLIRRHKFIFKILDDVMKRIHALAIHAFTSEEYENNKLNLSSPDCANRK